MRVYLFVFFLCVFPRDGRPSGPRISREGSLEWKLEVLVPFLSDQKN